MVNLSIAADLDNDGDMDMAYTVGGEGDVSWYENDGNQNFTKNFIDELDDSHSIFAVDMDNDGDMDVLSSSMDNSELAWYEFGCITVDLPVLTEPTGICIGDTANVFIAGNLNGALDWGIYSGSCNGISVGSTDGNSFIVSPNVTTTY